MAIHVSHTLPELGKLAERYGIQDKIVGHGKNGKVMKEDYIYPMRDYFLTKRYGNPDNTPDYLRWVIDNMKSPMLAERIDKLKEAQQNVIWESNEWYFEEKMNGCRMLIIKDNSGIHIISRHNSDEDFLPIEYTDTILFPDNFDIDKIPDNFILDTEVTSDTNNLNTIVAGSGVRTETMLQAVTALLSSDVKRAQIIQKQNNIRLTFNVFDCVYFNGQWLMNTELKYRRKIAFEMWKKLEAAGFKIKPVRSNLSNKRQFYRSIVLAGGEGCVAKNINGIYLPDTNRQDWGWIKIKRSLSESASMDDELGGFGDTIDGFITGFELGDEKKGFAGMLGSMIISVNLERADGTRYLHEIAKISGIDITLRKDMIEYIDGIPTLKARYMNRVVEFDGQGISAREMRVNHATFIQFRNEKKPDDCVMKEEFLKKLIL